MIDLQSSETGSRHDLNNVGITNIRYPVVFEERGQQPQAVTGNWKLGVRLPKERRGTHMSRFVSELDRLCQKNLSIDRLVEFVKHLKGVLEAPHAQVAVTFEWFRRVEAPVSRQSAMMDYLVSLSATTDPSPRKMLTLEAAAKSLCPCSKAISDRGAHNQRSRIRVELTFDAHSPTPTLSEIVKVMENSASSPVYPLLKREDEKYVTEFAYDHPSFVEDISRNIADKLVDLPHLVQGKISAVNQESIHNHDCFSELVIDPP